jgi:hypothetical protein
LKEVTYSTLHKEGPIYEEIQKPRVGKIRVDGRDQGHQHPHGWSQNWQWSVGDKERLTDWQVWNMKTEGVCGTALQQKV